MEHVTKDERVKLVLVGAAVIGSLTLGVLLLYIGWHYVPGLFGEYLGMIAGLLGTPFILEASFLILGFVVVILLNHWRMKRDGDEFVYLEQVDGPDIPAGMPDQAKWAVYKEKPLPGTEPTRMELAEGAAAIGDWESVAARISEMDGEELVTPGVLRVRIELARATGREDLLPGLEMELARAEKGC